MASTPDRVTALIVAAGSGERMGGDLPKQFRTLAGRSVLAHAIDALSRHPLIDAVRVVIAKGQEEVARRAIAERDIGDFIVGGASRAESVEAGLRAIGSGIVLVHDAARPFCPPVVVDRLIDALARGDGAVPVLCVADTLASGENILERIVDRRKLMRVQTPQAAHVEDLLYAIDEGHGRGATDESSLLIAAGLKVIAVEGDPMLDKLTTSSDWDRAETGQAAQMIVRTGMGFDVHAFAGDGPLVMGGITIPFERGLAGHSDADVVLHAITDALLGAAAKGDIGQHFPPSDPQWKGASSDRFLAHAASLIRDEDGIIDHVDCTVICEAPKVGPHRDAIRDRVADILMISRNAVSIKATTTERLGFTGRGEGIAAQAVATIRMPAVA
ncbi:bifunctional 2-C-methyl-D-erythritol 4-phosphate cytidylyltransferase/2-C-methyl-D-erythritol 2,4-cyclodiphosphate synthase [Sphingomonas sp. LY29]|uniref:bifunctional 2-C-methyl-D-erythritol 4-phosphate cytidylyltransferase/2-C-methyl-D-erythritol 2,4-cyclodiphosphate synthase n=1 Tax=Sphingomonas sp. LY29 TaxID=3095341 RepID=UPI002D77BEEF|nr:bifunctional 2-C-methyl-D-erythritol 4-phosphate cytidylyltransferase/2-C-methyl-D-erythritol 2,4-cyclodiphosphate synthase [Sphingomonas sp. LY29]WRP26124.1 bifunctional 2-C-methyl-D-erythritol 4-phosphate cytidylyltransferase/2-C-methyl-D-erythritol 2,4-cyclodiphosphate synthase [Sphingomonas sp. LY29]